MLRPSGGVDLFLARFQGSGSRAGKVTSLRSREMWAQWGDPRGSPPSTLAGLVADLGHAASHLHKRICTPWQFPSGTGLFA